MGYLAVNKKVFDSIPVLKCLYFILLQFTQLKQTPAKFWRKERLLFWYQSPIPLIVTYWLYYWVKSEGTKKMSMFACYYIGNWDSYHKLTFIQSLNCHYFKLSSLTLTKIYGQWNYNTNFSFGYKSLSRILLWSGWH